MIFAFCLLEAGALQAQPGASIEGRVLDPQGVPASSIAIRLKAGSRVTDAKTDAAGHYRFTGLPAGSYILDTDRAGSTAQAGPFTLASDETKHIDLKLGPAAPEFFDQPNFIVAGVEDGNNRGGHGSDTVRRSSDALTKAATSLHSEPVKPALSEAELRDSLSLDPNNAEAHHSLALILEERGKSLEAVREFERAAENDSSERNYFDWGAELLEHHAYQAAADVFTRGLNHFPASTRMLLGLASSFYVNGLYDQAAERFFQATDVDPRDAHSYLILAQVEIASITESDSYLIRMARFARLHPELAIANYQYAVALWNHRSNRNTKEVEALLKKAASQDSELAAAHLQLGIVYAAQNLQKAAIAEYERAVAINPRSLEAHYRLAQAYVRTHQNQKAQAEFEIHERLSKESAADTARQRQDVQRFVIELKNAVPARQ